MDKVRAEKNLSLSSSVYELFFLRHEKRVEEKSYISIKEKNNEPQVHRIKKSFTWTLEAAF